MPHKIDLAQLPTPIQRLPRLSKTLGVDLRVKRDDLTGLGLSGNKVRKLEFLFADARRQLADTVITCGGAGSNHCRATAIAASRLGMSCILLLRTERGQPPAEPWSGNLMLARMAGAEIRFVTPAIYRSGAQLFEPVENELRRDGRVPYVIPEGGSNAIGALGYAWAYSEIMKDWPDASSVISAMGSGGTAAGLVMGRRFWGYGPRIVAVNVCDDAAWFRARIQQILGDDASDDLDIVDGWVGDGYAKSTREELAFIAEVARMEGLLLDPVYTGKAFRAMVRTLVDDRDAFGPHPLFLHTGGAFGLFPEAEGLSAV